MPNACKKKQAANHNLFFNETAATTFDICKNLAVSNTFTKQIRILSMLALSPETAALFDEKNLMHDAIHSPVRIDVQKELVKKKARKSRQLKGGSSSYI